MRNLLLICFLIISLTSCQDEKKETNSNDQTETDYSNNNPETNAEQKESFTSGYDTTEVKNRASKELESEKSLNGIFVKTDETLSSTCDCYCLDLQFSGTSELCIKENELYINARYQKDGENINVYYTGKSPRTSDTEIPWEKFQSGTPIAVITQGSNNNLEFDWKGFSIDDKIAVDYALLGKKALEGTYKKK